MKVKSGKTRIAVRMPRQGGKAFNTANEMFEQIAEYFKYCEENKQPTCMVGIAQYLGICQLTLHRYASGEYDTELQDFSGVIRVAKDYTEHDKIINGLTGVYNSNMTKFVLENNYNWSEKKSVELKPTEAPTEAAPIPPGLELTADEALRLWQETCRKAVAGQL